MFFHNRFNQFCLLFLSLWLVCLSACGKKDPPIIPRIVTPQAVTDLKAEAGCDKILLSFTKPDMNSDGSSFDDLYGFQVYRRVLKARIDPTDAKTTDDEKIESDDQTAEEFKAWELPELPVTDSEKPVASRPESESGEGPDTERTRAGQDTHDALQALTWVPVKKSFKRIMELSMKELAARNTNEGGSTDDTNTSDNAGSKDPAGSKDAPGKDDVPAGPRIPVRFIDDGDDVKENFTPNAHYLYQYQYKIRLINDKDDYSPFSNTAIVIYQTVPQAPKDIQWQRLGNSVELSWEPPMVLCDERPLEGTVSFNIYKRTKGQRPQHRPINTEPISTYHYRIDHLDTDTTYIFSIRSVMFAPLRQSENASEIDVVIPDIIPPPVPTGLVAIGGFQLVSLLWDPVQAKDLKGYNVYRRATDVDEWQLVSKEPITGTTWVDRGIDMSRDYYYTVTAVDRSPQANESNKSATQLVSFR